MPFTIHTKFSTTNTEYSFLLLSRCLFNELKLQIIQSNVIFNLILCYYFTASSVAVLSSTVSSKILKTIAEQEGFRFEETLTGFKWLGNRSCELELQNIKTIFAFEEAIGKIHHYFLLYTVLPAICLSITEIINIL